jgi:hypothetical protein
MLLLWVECHGIRDDIIILFTIVSGQNFTFSVFPFSITVTLATTAEGLLLYEILPVHGIQVFRVGCSLLFYLNSAFINVI